jgi:hypothetical protein
MAENSGLSKSTWSFDPRSISGCKLWYDAGDTSTLTIPTGTNVSIMRNKALFTDVSAVGVLPTTGAASLNGLNLLSIGNDVSLVTAPNISYDSPYRSLFVVAQVDASGTSGSAYTFLIGTSSTGSLLLYTDLGNGIYFARAGAFISAAAAPSNFYNSSFILTANNNVPLNDRGIYFNGSNLNLILDNCGNLFNTGVCSQEISGTTGGRAGWRLGEMLLYDEQMSRNDRQIVEGYLAWRWGLTARLPTTHPFKSEPPFLKSFSPIDVSGCILWLDCADPTSMTLSGSNVSQLNDKSGSGNHAIQATGSNQPILVSDVRSGNSVVRFSGLGVSNTTTTTFFSNTAMSFPNAPYTVFAVAQSSNTVSYTSYSYIFNVGATTTYALLVGSRTSTFTTFAGNGSSWNDANALSGTQPTSNWTTMSVVNRGTNSGLFPYINGNLRTLKNGPTVARTGYTIGEAPAPFRGQNWNGDIGEILVFNRDIGADRQRIEGYLTRKWGLVSELPSNHYNASNRLGPQTIPFQTRSISSLVLWLDGTDPCGNNVRPASGTNVLTWFDKSGLSNNLTAPTGAPTYDSVNSAVKFGGSPTWARNTSLLSPVHTTFFVYKNYNAGGPIFTTGGSNVDGFWPNAFWDTTLNRFTIARQDGTNFGFWYAQNNTPFPLNRTCMITVQYAGSAVGSAIVGWLDASQIFTTTVSGAINRSYFGLAARQLVGDYLTADYYEVMQYTRVLSVQERQEVEGYLAWKWNLVPYLPESHPYKKVRP